MTASTGISYNKMYWRFAGEKKTDRNNEVIVLTRWVPLCVNSCESRHFILCSHRLFRAGNFCPVCLKVYRNDESDLPMVCCDMCDRWVHTGLAKSHFKLHSYFRLHPHHAGEIRNRSFISTVTPTVHTNPSRKRSFRKRSSNRTNLKTAFRCRVDKRSFLKTMTLR